MLAIYTQAPKFGFGGAAKTAHETFDFKLSRYCFARFVARGAFGYIYKFMDNNITIRS